MDIPARYLAESYFERHSESYSRRHSERSNVARDVLKECLHKVPNPLLSFALLDDKIDILRTRIKSRVISYL